MKTIFTILLFASLGFGQCTQTNPSDPNSGTTCTSPIRASVAHGKSPTTIYEFVPATAQFPCPTIAQADKTFAVCGQMVNGVNYVTYDFGDGKGYQLPPPGPKGDKGDPGTNGSNGTNGTNGLPATVAIGNVSTLPAGSSAAVTNSGSAQNAVFNFALPQGIQGISGQPWSTAGHTFAIKCARGGNGVPNFNVTGCTITQLN
jgi:hypothetical protein